MSSANPVHIPYRLTPLFASVFEFLPFFEERMRAALRLILGDDGEKRIRMGLARDGSGVGGRWHAAWAYCMSKH